LRTSGFLSGRGVNPVLLAVYIPPGGGAAASLVLEGTLEQGRGAGN
jgi:hypothetical protein